MNKLLYTGLVFMVVGILMMSVGTAIRMQEEAVDVATKEQHVKDLKSIFSVYEAQCDADTPAAVKKSDEFCDGVRESYWKTQNRFWNPELL